MNQLNYKRFLELFWEFNSFIVSLHTLYLDSIIGYKALHNVLARRQKEFAELLGECDVSEEEFQDECSISYKDLCGENYNAVSMRPLMKQGEVKKRTKIDGDNWILIGRQCVVSAYTYWEEYLRKEIAYALGVLNPEDGNTKEKIDEILNNHVSDDFWGDIRHFRNSSIHKNGIANSDMKKCKILKWFEPDEPIYLDHTKMKEIFLHMGRYRNKLHSYSIPSRNGITIN